MRAINIFRTMAWLFLASIVLFMVEPYEGAWDGATTLMSFASFGCAIWGLIQSYIEDKETTKLFEELEAQLKAKLKAKENE